MKIIGKERDTIVDFTAIPSAKAQSQPVNFTLSLPIFFFGLITSDLESSFVRVHKLNPRLEISFTHFHIFFGQGFHYFFLVDLFTTEMGHFWSFIGLRFLKNHWALLPLIRVLAVGLLLALCELRAKSPETRYSLVLLKRKTRRGKGQGRSCNTDPHEFLFVL